MINLHERMLPIRRGSNPQPPDLQSDAHSTKPARPAEPPITKTCLYNFAPPPPLKPHFYIVKLGFTGVYIIFLISAQNIDYWYSLEPPRRSGSNENPQSMFWAETWKIQKGFLSENFQFLEVKFSIYFNRRIFVMDTRSRNVKTVPSDTGHWAHFG